MSDPITRLNAALEGRYRVERQLGEGGMATVYLADDLRHERKVALKVLKPELAAVVGADRFLAEIKTTANLQHPHILPLFDSGEASGFLFYVMPYVEGESLRERLDREHQLPVDEAVQIAKNIAEGLDYAHRHGVVHRDIKPANILLQDGKPVVSDFGIALALGAAGAGRLTETGLSLGTPHYMSPEQATGDVSVGAATDIYALGCVLYEMLVGEPPYTGSTPQAVLGRIISGAVPSATAERKSVPPNVEGAIRRALEKIPADRFTEARELARALSDPGFRHGELTHVEGAVPATRGGRWNRLSVATTSLAGVLALALAWALLRPEPPRPVDRFQVGTLDGSIWGLNVIPDGTGVVYGSPQVMLRRWTSLEPVPIAGAVSALPFASVSPSGDEVAFRASSGRLNVVPLTGGVVRGLAENVYCCIRWGADGYIYFSPSVTRNIQRVPETGGAVEDVTARDPGSGTQGDFQILPGGDVGVLTSDWGPADAQIEAIRLSTGERSVLTRGIKPHVTATGHLVFGSPEGQILAAPFDADGMELTGPAVLLVDNVYVTLGNIPAFGVSDDGSLVYVEAGQAGATGSGMRLVVVDMAGTEEALPVVSPQIGWVGWSPDGASVVYNDLEDGQIYTYNVELGTTPRQLTFEGVNAFGVYSPDGTQIAFTSAQEPEGSGVAAVSAGVSDIFVKRLTDDSPPRLVATLEGDQWLTQWQDDRILFEWGPRGGASTWDLGVLDLTDPADPEADLYLESDAVLRDLLVSPDGRVAAYRSNETVRPEIYVRSFPEPGGQTLVSQNGGTAPFWSPDGNTLYYARGNGDGSYSFFAARLERDPVTVVLSTDSLFTGLYSQPFSGAGLHPDGDRWILSRLGGGGASGGDDLRIILVQNLFEELERLVPTR